MANTDNITLALVIVLSINLMLFLGQFAVIELNPSTAPVVYNVKGSLLCEFDANNCIGGNYTLDDSDPTSRLPSSEPSVAEGETNFFMDIFANIKTWFNDVTGLNFLIEILGAPKNFLHFLGLPQAFSFALSGIWYALTLFLILAFFWGR